MDSYNHSTVACPQCGYKGSPLLKIRDNEFLIKCQCCTYTVHTNQVMTQLINIWNEEAERNNNESDK